MTATITTPTAGLLTDLAFNALFEKIVSDVTAGDDTLLTRIRHLSGAVAGDPGHTTTLVREDPHPAHHGTDPAEGPGWAVLTTPDLVSTTKTTANLLDLTLAVAATPRPEDDIHRTAARLARRLGTTPGRALTYCDIGTMLTRMPATCHAVCCGAFGLELLRILADVTCCVDDSRVAAVDRETAALLTPTRPRQAVPGPVTLRRAVTAVVETHQPTALPTDPLDPDTGVPPADLQPGFQIDTRNPDITCFHIALPVDEATGVTRIIDSVATAHGVSRAAAFAELCHGAAGDVTVTLNCYRNLDDGTTHLENLGLGTVATDRWIRRVTDLTVPSHSRTTARFASPAQKALVAGVDGTCRAPGCERPAATADTDHVERFAGNPVTDTRGAQSLCRGCHNEKTRGITDYTRHCDGTTYVTSIDDGHTVVTVPTGPLAAAVLTFDRRLARRAATRAAHHEAREARRQITRDALAEEVPF